MNDALGDRMKRFEGIEADRRFLPMLPVCARLDGKCFSSFTRGLERPFDKNLHGLMVDVTKYLVEETNANMGYTQSDEISIVWYSDKYESRIFFDGRIQKMNSVLASMCSVKFNKAMQEMWDNFFKAGAGMDILKQWDKRRFLIPVFDSRVWTVPNCDEAVNTFLWRENDCLKNSISQAASHYYSHKELMGKNGSEKQEMLHKKGVNFNDYPVWFKKGSYFQRRKVVRRFTVEEWDRLPPKHEARNNPNLRVERVEVIELDMPILSKVVNRVDVFFKGERPKVKE